MNDFELLFWDTASPSTLACLIADVACLGTGATTRQLRLERLTRQALVANVGETEAERLIQGACDGLMSFSG